VGAFCSGARKEQDFGVILRHVEAKNQIETEYIILGYLI